MKKYMLVVDVRTGRRYIDLSDTFIRVNIEKILDKAWTVEELKKKYPDAMDLTEGIKT